MSEPGPVTIVTDDRLLDHDTGGGGHPESPQRVMCVRERLRRGPLAARLTWAAPRAAERRWIELVHDEAYVARFEEESLFGRSFLNHTDNQICHDSYQVALLSAGSGLTAIDLVETAPRGSVFCCTRPPGHHAERALAMGFCFLNNAAIAARYWQAVYRRQRILVVDWDAHHGNGIQAAFEEDRDVFYVSIHEHPTFSFPGTGLAEETGSGAGAGATLNVPLPPGAGDATMLTALSDKVYPAVDRFRPEAIVVAAGFDGHRLDDMSSLAYSTRLYGRLGEIMAEWARRYCAGRIVSILEGGYQLEALGESVESYLTGLSHDRGTLMEGESPCMSSGT